MAAARAGGVVMARSSSKEPSLFSVDVDRTGEFYPTPIWFADWLFERHFASLGSNDVVLDPSAGVGHFLAACPATVPAYGIEINPQRARECETFSGRQTFVGDFRTLTVDVQPTHIIGSPPFSLTRPFLDRAHAILPRGGQVGFILPTSILSHSRPVRELNERWSIRTELIPRDIYEERPHIALMFAIFSKDEQRMLVGLAGFHETANVRDMRPRFRALLTNWPSPRVWREVVQEALTLLGGRGTIAQINMVVEGQGYARGSFWREKIRQTAGRHFDRVERGTYQLPAAA
jgi:hypothetical protein